MSEFIRRQVDVQIYPMAFDPTDIEQEMDIFRAQFREMAHDNEWQLESVEVFGNIKGEQGNIVWAMVTMAKYEYLTLEEYRKKYPKTPPEVVEAKMPKVGEKKE